MVKCADCGFLTLRNRRNGLLVGVDEDYRVSGRVAPDIANEDVYNYPLCFARAWNLMPEVQKAAGEQLTKRVTKGGGDSVDIDEWWRWGEKVLGVITDDRGCPPPGQKLGFAEWQQGFTPKEHREMIDRTWALENQERREREDKKWREKQEEKMRDWQERREGRRFGKEVIVFGIIVTSFVVAAQILGPLIPFWLGP